MIRRKLCVFVSLDGDILVVAEGKVLQWLSFKTGKVIGTTEHAHKADSRVNILAAIGDKKKLKLWKAPALP
ncbi:hypothetical protein Tco_0049904 [Tanacetum coccineum]